MVILKTVDTYKIKPGLPRMRPWIPISSLKYVEPVTCYVKIRSKISAWFLRSIFFWRLSSILSVLDPDILQLLSYMFGPFNMHTAYRQPAVRSIFIHHCLAELIKAEIVWSLIGSLLWVGTWVTLVHNKLTADHKQVTGWHSKKASCHY